MILRACITFSLAATLMTCPAQATQPEATQRIVHIEDLDLSTAGGMYKLRHRVAAALEAVCGSYAGTQGSGADWEAEEITQCRSVAQTKIDQQIGVIVSGRLRIP